MVKHVYYIHILVDLKNNEVIKKNPDKGYIVEQCNWFLDGDITNKKRRDLFYRNVKVVSNGKEVLEIIKQVFSRYIPQVLQKSETRFTLDGALLLAGMGKKSPNEIQTNVVVPEPLIYKNSHRCIHTEYIMKSPSYGLTVTVLVPPWHFNEKLHKRLIDFAKAKGPVIEFIWKEEAISADVETTAQSYYRMIDFLSNSLKEIHYIMKHQTSDPFSGFEHIRIIACSAGLSIVTGALKRLYDEGSNKAIFDSIIDVTLVGMGDLFADCYRYGARTKHIGEVAEKNGYNIHLLRKKFAHMAPIKGIPALENVKGDVTWITSFSDVYFPLQNQKNVIAEIERRGSKIKVINIPKIGHIGISAVYYVLGAGLTDTKNVRTLIRKIITRKFMEVQDRIMEKLEKKFDEWLDKMFPHLG